MDDFATAIKAFRERFKANEAQMEKLVARVTALERAWYKFKTPQPKAANYAENMHPEAHITTLLCRMNEFNS